MIGKNETGRNASAVGYHEPAAHIEHLTGYVGRFLRGKIHCCFGNLLGTADSADRHPARKLLQGLFTEIAEDGSVKGENLAERVSRSGHCRSVMAASVIRGQRLRSKAN